MNEDFIKYKEELEEEIHRVWTPHEGQLPIVSAFLLDWVTGVFSRCGRKFGKALALDTPILTPYGFVGIGDIKKGDIVYDEKGQEQSVLVAHNIINKPDSYRITFCDKTQIDACGDHQWLTWTKKDRKNEKRNLFNNPSVKSTLEIFNSQMDGKEYNHSIPYAKPVSMDEKYQEIDPYLFGCWLGDGHTHKAAITNIDQEILDSFVNGGYELSRYDEQTYGIKNGFVTKLKSIGVLKNKYVPKNYLYCSIDQRRALLQGLMDTDGCVNKNGNSCEFIQKNRDIADAVYFLSASLGMKPFRNIKNVMWRGEKKYYWRISFRPIGDVFRLKRKQDRITRDTTKRLHRTIISVERVRSKPMRCLTVSGKSKLFLAGEGLVPTHNTELAIYLMYMFGLLFENSEIYYIADEQDHGRDICWDNGRLPRFFTTFRRNPGESLEDFEERRRFGNYLQNKYVVHINNSEMSVRLSNGTIMKVDGAKNFKKADGLSPAFVVYDEFKNHDARFDMAMRPNLMTFKGRIFIIGTAPDNEDNHYCLTEKEFRMKKGHVWIKRPSFMNPHVYPGGQFDEHLLEEEKAYRARGEWHVFAREFLSEIVPDQKAMIFPMLRADKHIKPYDEMLNEVRKNYKKWDFYLHFDPGTTTVFAALIIAINRYDKRVFLLDEIYEEDRLETTSKKIWNRAMAKVESIHPMTSDWYMGYDCAAAWFQTEIQVEFGENLIPCVKELKKKESQLSVIKDAMLYDRWIFSDRCKRTFTEYQHYKTDEHGRIPKEKDHNIDNSRYIMKAAHYYSVPKEPLKKKSNEDKRFTTMDQDLSDNETNEYLMGGIDELDYHDGRNY